MQGKQKVNSTGSRGLIPHETNTSRYVNTPTPPTGIHEDLSQFPNHHHVFNNIDLDNILQIIENFESNVGEQKCQN